MRSITSHLNEKLISTQQTPANKADPKMSIKVSRARTTVMDTDYWTVETIRTGDNLGDISLAARRRLPYGSPDSIYEIHVEGGLVKTSIRNYPDFFKLGWQPQFELGGGISVAIAFNGNWQLYRKRWRLTTDEKPFIFWVDNQGILWSQLWDQEDTKREISSSVVKVKAIRGWKNVNFPDKDQGVIVSYIKIDGKVYYSSYCQTADYTYLWEPERQLTDFSGTAVSLNMFITNDYRMGFTIEDNLGDIHWLITDRNWAGMASPIESISTGIDDIIFEVTPIAYYDTFGDNENIEAYVDVDRFYVCPANIVPEIVSTERLSFADQKTIQVTFNYNLECDVSNLKAALTLQNMAEYGFTIDSVTEDGNVLTITTLEKMPFAQDIILRYCAVGSYYLAFRISSTCLYDYSNTISLTVEGLPPIGFTEEHIEANIDVVFTVTQVYYRNAYNGSENVEATIADISFAVTKVGNNPL